MAFLQCDTYSETLGTRVPLNAYIPLPRSSDSESTAEPIDGYPVLFLLHGLHSNYTAWMRNSSVERYASERGLALIMPDARRSFYTNMRHGYQYFDFFARELPEIANRLFPISRKRENRFVAGLSMGGYGAFKIAFSCPEQYCAAASLSGALSFSRIEEAETLLPEWKLIFGENDTSGTENDLNHLATQYAQGDNPPLALFQCCGTEDYLYPSNQHFLDHARASGLDIHYEEGPGEHSWDYWDPQIRRVVNWLPIETPENSLAED